MAQTTPAGISTESSTFTTIVSVVALVAIIALIYFVARGRGTTTVKPEKPQAPIQREVPEVK